MNKNQNNILVMYSLIFSLQYIIFVLSAFYGLYLRFSVKASLNITTDKIWRIMPARSEGLCTITNGTSQGMPAMAS